MNIHETVTFQGFLPNICELGRNEQPSRSGSLDESSAESQHSKHMLGAELDMRGGEQKKYLYILRIT